MLSTPGAYVHFPWCVRKCPYCDFNSHPLRDTDSFTIYTQQLICDWQHQAEQLPDTLAFSSVFLGGGTPSLFEPESIHQVIAHLPLTKQAEVTMEANPGTTEHADFADYYHAGVNRLSLGAQSFDDKQLQKLGRIHASSDTHVAFEKARAGGFRNINIDLMWGLPEQSVNAALADLDEAIALGAEHISWYQLTIEAKTEFARRPPILPVDESLATIERLGLARLADAGFTRYEVSAFARNDNNCIHNTNYWSFGDYVGIGAGAHGKLSTQLTDHIEITRTAKPTQPRLYQAEPTKTQYRQVDQQERILEFMMNALRLVDGVEQSAYTHRTGLAWEAIDGTWQKLVDDGLVRADRCATTAKGLRYLDSVLGEFLGVE